MKKYFFGFLAIALALGFSAFTTKKAHKPFTTATFYYNDMASHQRADFGVSDPDPQERSIDQNTGAAFKNTSNWNPTSNSAAAYVSGDKYINTVFISNYSSVDDSDDSNGICLQEALDKIYAVFAASPNLYPAAVSVDTDGMGGNDVSVTTTLADGIY